MKSMEEYISEVYKRYEESERNHEVYKKVRMTRKRPLTTLCSVTACLLVACVCFIGYGKYNTPPVIDDNPVFVEKNENEDNTIIYTKYIKVNSGIFEEQLKKIINKSEIIAIIDNVSNVNSFAEIKNKRVFVKSKVDLNISKILKGNNLIKKNQIEILMLGGVLSLSDIQQYDDYDWDEWEMLNLQRNIPDDEKANTYYEMRIKKAEILEKDKQYLVFLEKENNIYNLTDDVYGIMEYDPVTNKVKNIDTGEFEEFDWDLLIDK